MSCFKNSDFYQNKPEIKSFFEKNTNFSRGWCALPSDLKWPPAAWGSAIKPAKQPLNAEISGYASD